MAAALLVTASATVMAEDTGDPCIDDVRPEGTIDSAEDGFDLTLGTYTAIRSESDLSLVDDPTDVAGRLVGLQFATLYVSGRIPLEHPQDLATDHAEINIFPGTSWFRSLADPFETWETDISDRWITQSALHEHLTVNVYGCGDLENALWTRDLLAKSGAQAQAEPSIARAQVQVDDGQLSGLRDDQMTLQVFVAGDGSHPRYYVDVQAQLELVLEVDDSQGPVHSVLTIQDKEPNVQTLQLRLEGNTAHHQDDVVPIQAPLHVYYAPVLPLERAMDQVGSPQEGADATSAGKTDGAYFIPFEVEGDSIYLHAFEVAPSLELTGVVMEPFTRQTHDVWGTVDDALNLV